MPGIVFGCFPESVTKQLSEIWEPKTSQREPRGNKRGQKEPNGFNGGAKGLPTGSNGSQTRETKGTKMEAINAYGASKTHPAGKYRKKEQKGSASPTFVEPFCQHSINNVSHKSLTKR